MNLALYLNGLQVDLLPDAELQLTYRVNDIRNPSSRETMFSETFNLPFTNRNDFIMQNIRQANSFSDAPYVLIPWYITVDENRISRGFASFTEMQDSYAVALTGESVDLFEMVKEKPLSALDLSDLDHAWTNSNVGTRNNHDPERGYLYPLINYGRLTERYLEAGNIRFDELYPAVYVKTLLERMAAPYKLAGSFINSPIFPKLILPFTNKYFQYRESYRAAWDMKVKLTYDYALGSLPVATPPFDLVENDPNSRFTNTGSYAYSYVAPFAGNYEVKANLGISTLFASNGTTNILLKVERVAGGAETWQKVELQSGDFQKVEINTTALNLAMGDIIILYVLPAGFSSDNYILANSTFEVKLQNVVFAGGQVHLDANLPDLTQDELLVDLFNLFNLVIQTNAVTKTVRLDFQNDLLTNAPVDWTKKIDWTETPKTVFALGNYAQSNRIGYEESETPDSLGNPVQESFELTVNNQQLEPEKDLFTSKFTHTETRPALQGNALLPYIPLYNQKVLDFGIFKPGYADYKAEDWVYNPDNKNYWVAQTDNPVEEFDVNVPEPNWQLVSQDEVFERLEAKPRIMLVSVRDSDIPVSEDFNPGSVYNLNTTATFTGLDAASLKSTFYPATQKMLTRTRMLNMKARLTPQDIAALDFLKPIRLNVPERDNLGGTFYLNAINGYQPGYAGATEIELVRISGGLSAAPVNTQEYSEEYSEEYN